jgi:hypothetical protein
LLESIEYHLKDASTRKRARNAAPHAQKGACTQGRAKERAKKRNLRRRPAAAAACGGGLRRPAVAAACGVHPLFCACGAAFGVLFCTPLRARALLRVRFVPNSQHTNKTKCNFFKHLFYKNNLQSTHSTHSNNF